MFTPGYHRARRYSGIVYIDPSRYEWIDNHRSFASKDWIISKVKWGVWQPRPDGSFEVHVTEVRPKKILTILICCRHYPDGGPHHPTDYVHVFHTHILRSKDR